MYECDEKMTWKAIKKAVSNSKQTVDGKEFIDS